VAVGLALALLGGCRSSASPTTSLEEIPAAGSPGASSWSTASSLEGLPEGQRKPFGPEPPELFFDEQQELPLPSRSMLPGQGPQKTIDRVVGRVNKDIITLSEVQELAQPLIARIPPAMPSEQRKVEILKVQNMVLDRIIDQRLQHQSAQRLGVSVSEKELEDAVFDVMARNNLTPEQFGALLQREGLSIQLYRKKIEEQIVRRRVFNFEVASRVQVSDTDVRDYYIDNPKDFTPQPAVSLSQIFIAVPSNGDDLARLAAREKARLILTALKKGEPFAVVARAHSEDPTKSRGGKLGRFTRGDMLPALEKVAFKMSEGEIRGPIVTDRGLHFIKIDRKWGDKPLPLEEVQQKVKVFLLSKKRNERYREWMEVLRRDAFIERVKLQIEPAKGG
jgi:peptidyl-prolyl cis-trans isomerase SurA